MKIIVGEKEKRTSKRERERELILFEKNSE